ncbi:MAG: hypothetical protein H0U97_12600 [Gammaproteobacteria bacterium]|nr:hypothetical protein [Gammaproteobacteria bacterium]
MNELLSKEFVPLYTALAWIVFWAGLLIFARTHLVAVFDAIAKRIRAGSSLTVGMVSIGEPPKDFRDAPNGEAAVSNTPNPEAIPDELTEDAINAQYKQLVEQQYFLLHASEVITERTSPKSGRYRVRVWLESYFDQSLNDVTRVTYRIWTDSNRPIISTTSKKTNFDLWLSMYGEFPVLAYVERRGKPGMWLTRYLDLPGRPPD